MDCVLVRAIRVPQVQSFWGAGLQNDFGQDSSSLLETGFHSLLALLEGPADGAWHPAGRGNEREQTAPHVLIS